MRLDFYVPLQFIDSETERFVAPPRDLNGRRACELELSQFLDNELADLGIVGGKIELAIGDEAEARISFWSPSKIDESATRKLTEYVRGQMSDGAGENGFDFEVDATRLTAMPVDEREIRFQQIDDGRLIPPANPVAIAARKGDVAEIRRGLQSDSGSADRPLMSYSPLHWGVYAGSDSAVEVLLGAGAAPDPVDNEGTTPLLTAVIVSKVDDETTLRIVRRLVEAGADPSPARNGWSAIDFAENRKKSKTAEYLRRVSSERS